MIDPVNVFPTSFFISFIRVIFRVFSDLKTLEMSKNSNAGRKSQSIFEKQEKSRKRQGKFIFNQSKHPKFENFLWEHAPTLTVLETRSVF